MSAYLAVIKDSFREALSSRVLWVLIVLTTLVLISLAPVSYVKETTTFFKRQDLTNPRELAREIHKQSLQSKPSVGRHLWQMFDPTVQKRLQKFYREIDPVAYRENSLLLVDALNALLERKDLFEENAWQDVYLTEDLRQGLRDPKKDGNDSRVRRHRLAVEAAFGDLFVDRPADRLTITYLGLSTYQSSWNEEDFHRILETMVLPLLFKFLLGVGGLLTAILVTAPIIPQMFETGTLSLLLSKPTSRTLLFLAKFLGGCTFILLLAGYLLTGIWLIAGTRLAVWNHGILLCIPLFVFLFLVYYCVSALAGVIWKNAIMCVVATVLMWILCFSLTLAKVSWDENNNRIEHVVRVDDGSLLAVKQSLQATQVMVWDEDETNWRIVADLRQRQALGAFRPIYDPISRRLLVAPLPMTLLEAMRAPSHLLVVHQDEDWRAERGALLPKGLVGLVADKNGSVLAVAASGVRRLVTVNTGGNKKHEDVADEKKEARKELAKRVVESTDKDLNRQEAFVSAGPMPKLAIRSPATAAADRVNNRLAVYTRGTVVMLQPERGTYRQIGDAQLEDSNQVAGLALAGSTLLLAKPDGEILQLNSDTLEIVKRHTLEKDSSPRQLNVSSDNRRIAVVFENGNLWLYDVDSGEFSRPKVTGQGDISGAAFTGSVDSKDGQLLVVDRNNRVSQYDDQIELIDRWAAKSHWRDTLYRRAIVPMHWLLPKPAELDNTVAYFLTQRTSETIPFSKETIDSQKVKVNPWTPIWSCLAFVVVVLAVACVYIERQEF